MHLTYFCIFITFTVDLEVSNSTYLRDQKCQLIQICSVCACVCVLLLMCSLPLDSGAVSSVIVLLQGMLCPDPLSRTNTLVYRLRALWRHVRRSRAAFESEPETGLIGKGFTRHLNRAWNYIVKGALGSFALVCVSVPACLLTSLLSLLTAFLVPAW